MATFHQSLIGYLHFYRYTPAQALYIVQGIRDRCTDPATAPTIDACDRALARIRAARKADAASTDHPDVYDGDPLQALDADIDACVGFIHQRLTSEAGSKAAAALSAQARAILALFFAENLRGHVGLPFREQSQANLELVGELSLPEHGALVAKLDLSDTLERLGALSNTFVKRLAEENTATRGAYRLAVDAVNDAVVQVVCGVIFHATVEGVSDWVALEALLRPLLDMNDQVHRTFLARRAAARAERQKAPTAAAGTPQASQGAVPPTAPAPSPSEVVATEPVTGTAEVVTGK